MRWCPLHGLCQCREKHPNGGTVWAEAGSNTECPIHGTASDHPRKGFTITRRPPWLDL